MGRNKEVEQEMKLAFGLALAAQASAAECPEGWAKIWNKATFEYYDLCWKHFEHGTFNQAVEKCAAVGASLPTPKNAYENQDFAWIVINEHISTSWLGVKWQQESQIWTDLEGNELTYQPWADAYPKLIPSANNNF